MPKYYYCKIGPYQLIVLAHDKDQAMDELIRYIRNEKPGCDYTEHHIKCWAFIWEVEFKDAVDSNNDIRHA